MMRFGHIVAVLLTALLAACATPLPTVYYTLNGDPLPGGAQGSPSILVLPAALPELLDRPQWVLQASDGQVVIKESRRWAEPLRNEISRVVAGELGRLLDSSRVLAPNGGAEFPADYRLSLDVQRVDATLGKGVVIDVFWRLEPTKGKALIGRSRLHEPAEGVNEAAYEQLLAAERRALQRVARDIAAEFRHSASTR
jgi:uncharacterized lipoprotein YmbA